MEKDIVDKFYNVFANEVKSKTNIKLPDGRYFKISSEEFLKNSRGLSGAIVKTVKG